MSDDHELSGRIQVFCLLAIVYRLFTDHGGIVEGVLAAFACALFAAITLTLSKR